MLETELIEAAKVGDLAALRCLDKLHGKYMRVNCRCPLDGSTPLYIAGCNGQLMVCDWLLRHGARPDYPTKKSGSIPLHGAAARGQCNCVRLLIRSSPSSVNARTRINGDTPLHLAAYRGHVDVCRILLAHGASSESINSQGRTALDEARTASHYDVFYLLINHRPSPTRNLRGPEDSKTEELVGSDRQKERERQPQRKMITEPMKISENCLTSTLQTASKDISSSSSPTPLSCYSCCCHYNPRIEDFTFCNDHIKPILESPGNSTKISSDDVTDSPRQKFHSFPSHSALTQRVEDTGDGATVKSWSTSDTRMLRTFDVRMSDLEKYLKSVQAAQSLKDRRISELEKENSNLMSLLASSDITKKELEASRALALSYIERATQAERDLCAVTTRAK